MLKLLIGDYEYFKSVLELKTNKVINADTFMKVINAPNLWGTTDTFITKDDKVLKLDFKEYVNCYHDAYIILPKIDKRSKLYKLLKKNNAITEQPELSKNTIYMALPDHWEHDYVVDSLYNVGDYSQVSNMINMIFNMDDISPERVNWLVSGEYDDKIFEAVEYLIHKDAIGFFDKYYDLKRLGESDYKIIVILYNQLKTILKIIPFVNLGINEICSKTGLTYYQVKSNLYSANKYSLTSMFTRMVKVVNLERDIRLGKIDLKFVESFYLELMKEDK